MIWTNKGVCSDYFAYVYMIVAFNRIDHFVSIERTAFLITSPVPDALLRPVFSHFRGVALAAGVKEEDGMFQLDTFRILLVSPMHTSPLSSALSGSTYFTEPAKF